MKKQLHVKELTFLVNACTWDEYGDEINAGCQFTLCRTEPVIKRKSLEDLTEPLTVRLEQGRYAKLLKQILHHYEIFCWDEDYGTGMDFETDMESGIPDNEFSEFLDESEEKADMEEITLTWGVSVKYTNGMEQVIKGTDEFLPDKVGELYSCFAAYFNQEEESDWELDDFDEED